MQEGGVDDAMGDIEQHHGARKRTSSDCKLLEGASASTARLAKRARKGS